MSRIWTLAHHVWLEALRRKEAYVLLILLAAFLMTLVSLDVFGLGAVVGYTEEMGLLAIWAMGWVLAVNISTRQLPREESRGTIFPLLAKPIARYELLAGKWLGAWAAAAGATVCFYGVLWLVVLLRGGHIDGAALTQAVLLHGAALAVVAALGIALSTRMYADAAATLTYVSSGAAFLIVPSVPALLMHTAGFRATALLFLYYALPHFELFDLRRRLVHDWGAAGWTTVALALAYGALWTAIFLVLSWLGYRRKRFSRGDLL